MSERVRKREEERDRERERDRDRERNKEHWFVFQIKKTNLTEYNFLFHSELPTDSPVLSQRAVESSKFIIAVYNFCMVLLLFCSSQKTNPYNEAVHSKNILLYIVGAGFIFTKCHVWYGKLS